MKRIFTLLMGGLVLFSTACDSDKESGVTGSEWFLTPESTVNGTTVEVRCETKFGAGVLTGANSGFTYAAVTSAGVGAFESTATVTASGSTIAATLSNLQPETLYVVYAYADFGGARMQSTGTTFTTGTATELPEPDPDGPAFGTPSATNVTASGATLSCGFTFEAPTSEYTLRFEYRPASGGSYVEKPVTAGTGVKSVTLSGLTASTAYEFRLCAEWQGERYVSGTGRFTTAASEGGGDPTGGLTAYSGWAELPIEKGAPNLYYAHHICPDFRVDGHLARNYTVCFSGEHHCPMWVAAPRHDCYEGTAGRTNAYKSDPDIPSDLQYYSKATGGGCNKGHMLGSAERTCTSDVNRQVFYYTNIAPQYNGSFNGGGGGWNILEDWIDTKVCADTTYLVIGTYFEKYTDRYGNTASPKKISFGGRNDVSCPTMFYIAALRTKSGRTGKSVMECSADELMCAVFVRCHNNNLKGVRVSSKDMISLAELEQLTGFHYFANVPNAPKDTYNPSDWGL